MTDKSCNFYIINIPLGYFIFEKSNYLNLIEYLCIKFLIF